MRNSDHNPRYELIDIDAIVYLVKDFRVLAERILL